MTYRQAMALVLAITMYPALASAQDRGTSEDQEACTPDVFRLCADQIPDEKAILACLLAKKTELSADCGAVLYPADAKTRKKH